MGTHTSRNVLPRSGAEIALSVKWLSYGPEDPDFDFRQRQDFSLLKTSWPALGATELPIQMVTGCSFLGVKWLGYGLEDPEFDFWQRRDFLFSRRPDQPWGPTELPIQMVTGCSFLGVKRPERETDRTLPSSAKVKNDWSYTTTLPVCHPTV